MKRILNIITLSAAVTILAASCKKDESPLDRTNEFSDVSFINSHQVDKFGSVYIDAGSAVNFMDLSHNAISHVWEISEGCHFLKGDYSVEDENLSDYIVNRGSTTTTDTTIGVLFEEAGERPVRLFNLFDSPVSYKGFEGSTEVTINSEWSEEYGAHLFDHTINFIVLDKVQAAYRVYKGVDTTGELLLEVGLDDVVDPAAAQEVAITAGESLTFEIHEDCESSRYNEIEWAFPKGEPIISPSTSARVVTVTYPKLGTGPSPLGVLTLKRNSSNNSNFKVTEMSSSKPIPITLKVNRPTENIVLNQSNITSLSGDNFITIDLGVYIDETSNLTAAASDFIFEAKDWKGDIIQLDVEKIELVKSEEDPEAPTSSFVVTFAEDQKLYADDTITRFEYTNNKNIKDQFGRTIEDFTDLVFKTQIEDLTPDWADNLHEFEDLGEYNTQSTHKAFGLTTNNAYSGTSLHYSKQNAETQGSSSIVTPIALIYYVGSNAKIQPIPFEAKQKYLCTFKVRFEKGLGDDKLQMRVKTAKSQLLTDIVFDFDTEDPANWGKWLDASVVIPYIDEDFVSSLSLRFKDTYTIDVPDTEFYIDNIEIYKDGKTTRAHDEYGLGLGDIESSGDL